MKISLIGLILMVFVFLAGGCATTGLPEKMKTNLEHTIFFTEVFKDPDRFKNRMVLWGGQILEITNTKEGTTELNILQSPLDRAGQPKSSDLSQGRFIALVDHYLDRAVYSAGRQITIIGKVQGKKVSPLGKGLVNYVYPLVLCDDIYLWPKEKKVYNYPPPYYWNYYWNPWWRYYYWGPDYDEFEFWLDYNEYLKPQN